MKKVSRLAGKDGHCIYSSCVFQGGMTGIILGIGCLLASVILTILSAGE